VTAAHATPAAAAVALRAGALTAAALVAFAANSILCRLALEDGTIDAASFTSLRVASGALVLLAIARIVRPGERVADAGSWPAAAALCGYAAAFSFAYLTLSAGTGALLLFGAVQLTMIAYAVGAGQRPSPFEWAGLATAGAGLVYLVAPGVTAPAPLGAMLMVLAGVCWGVYSLLGRGGTEPTLDTAANFARATPLALAVSVIAALIAGAHASTHGALLAVTSGAITSGLGYVVWYAALRHLTATRAAIVQLTVPLLAALGGVALLDERVTARLLVSALLILGGVGLAITARTGRSR
jgi:drug/metabolite transporter (DMT)-like permease